MRLRTASVSRCSVLVLGGSVSAEDAAELRGRLDEMLVHDTGEMVICDLSHVRSADPAAMTVFASHHGLDGGPGPGLCLAGATGDVAEVLSRLEIDRVLPVAPSVEAALELARSRPPRLCAVRSLTGNPSAPRLARRFALDTCAEWGLDAVADDVVLVVAELVNNGVDHAGTDLVLRLERTTDRVMVSVRDGAGGTFEAWWRGERGEPADDPRLPVGEPVWGHGLTIVRGLAESVGVHADASGGKAVWALLSAVPAADPGAVGRRPLRWRLMVNTGRGPANDGSPWVVRLELAWVPDRPDQVSLMLSSRPRHPSLPRGRWRVSRSALRDGLCGPVRHDGVRLWPDRSGRQLLLELPGDPPRMMRVSAARVRQFLTATGLPPSATDQAAQAGRAATTDVTGTGP